MGQGDHFRIFRIMCKSLEAFAFTRRHTVFGSILHISLCIACICHSNATMINAAGIHLLVSVGSVF